VLETKVTATNCVSFGLDVQGFPPNVGDKEDETYVLVQNGGELTRLLDDVDDHYIFRGAVSQGGGFEFGSVITAIEGPPAVQRIELVTGQFNVDEGSLKATTSKAKIRRRYLGGIVDCSADVEVVAGVRTLAGDAD